MGGSFKQNDNPDRPATVSTFRLDDGEVTNLRFVKFKTAWDNGWRPAAGSGKHSHLRAGAGLLTMDGASETGWSTGWAIYVDLGEATRTGSDDVYATWGTEVRPVNFVNFYEAYAFCIWDGGFLPSAAEWSYASSGGAEQRAFPWGATVPGTNSTYAIYGCWYRTPTGTCANVINIAPVGATNGYPALFGQFDLAGNVAELVLGGLTTAGACDDCLELAVAPGGFADQVRGGAFNSDASALRNDATPPSVSRTTRSAEIGFRCARPP